MKYLSLILFFFSVLAIDSGAQDKPKLQFSFQAGFPITLHSDYHNNFSWPPELFNYNLGFGVHHTVSSWLRSGFEFQFYNFGYDKDVYSRSSTRNNVTILEVENLSHAISLMISNDFYIARNRNSVIAPFFSLDIGAARITERSAGLLLAPDNTTRVTAIYNNWMGSFGIGYGFIFPLSSYVDLQIEARYTGWFNEDVPIRFMPVSASLYF